MRQTIRAQINFFGPYIKKEDILKILDPKAKGTLYDIGPLYDLERNQLELFFDLPSVAISKEILKRYIEATEESHIAIVPHTEEIFERLLRPLKSAKKNYCLGDYSSTIASCGIVGEMLAILIWKMNAIKLRGQQMTEKDEIGLFGRSFERLGQERKLDILITFGQINEIQYNNLNTIRNNRRPYLHWWSANLKNEKKDALDTLKKSFQLFKEVTDIGLADAGTVKVSHLLLKFLNSQKVNS